MFGRLEDIFDELNLDVKLMTLRTDTFVVSEEATNNIRSNEYKNKNKEAFVDKKNKIEFELKERMKSAKSSEEMADIISSVLTDTLMDELPEEYRNEVLEAINKLPDKTSILAITNCITEIAAKHTPIIKAEEAAAKTPVSEAGEPITGMDFSSLITPNSDDKEEVHPVTQESLDKALSKAK